MLHVVVELRRPAAPAAELIGNSAKRKKCKNFSHVLLAVLLYVVCVLLATSTVAVERKHFHRSGQLLLLLHVPTHILHLIRLQLLLCPFHKNEKENSERRRRRQMHLCYSRSTPAPLHVCVPLGCSYLMLLVLFLLFF